MLYFPADVHTFNALITAVPFLKDRFLERWELIKVSRYREGLIVHRQSLHCKFAVVQRLMLKMSFISVSSAKDLMLV